MEYAETRTEVSMRVKRFRVFGRCWPASQCVILRHGPARQIESVSYRDSDNTYQTISTDDWGIYEHLGSTVLEFHNTPPSVGSIRRDAVEVTYLAGYGAIAGAEVNEYGFPYILPLVLGQSGGAVELTAGSRLPEPFRQAIYMMVAHWYENRETVVIGTISGKLAHAADDLLMSGRIFGT